LTGHGLGLEVVGSPIMENEKTQAFTRYDPFSRAGLFIQKVGGIRFEDIILITDSGYEILSLNEKVL
jgi:Xaa-Pro aminopeptidase